MPAARPALLVWLLAGCYYYQPLSTPTPVLGSNVALALTDSGTDHLWRYLGPDVGMVRGRLVAATDTSYEVAVDAVDMRHGQTLDWKGERVVIARTLVANTNERKVSIGRSVLVGGLSAAGFVAALEAFKGFGFGGGPSGGGGPPK